MRLSIICSFGGVAALAGSAHLASYGEFGAAGALGLIGVVALGLVAWSHGVSVPARLRPGGRARRAAAPAFAVLLVVSVVATGPAMAAYGFQDCDLSDSLLGAFLSSFTSPAEDGECRFNPADADYANATQTDHYAMAVSQNDSNTRMYLSAHSWADDTRATAWTEAKFEIVNSLNNGTNESQAAAAAKEEVRDYYTEKQLRLINQWEAGMEVARYINDSRTGPYVHTFTGRAGNPSNEGRDLEGFYEKEVTLHNGSTVWVTHAVGDGVAETWLPNAATDPGNDTVRNITGAAATRYTSAEWEQWGSVESDDEMGVYIKNVSGLGNGANITEPGSTRKVYDLWSTQSDQITTQIDTYTSEVYSAYSAGELNTSDLLTASDLASRASTEYGSTGYYGFLDAELATLGLSSDLNSSTSVMMNGSQYDGTLFYTGDDVTTFANGTTYEPANLSGTAYMTHQTANGSTIVELSENFTIVSLTDPNTGESLNSTEMEQYTTSTHNASALEEELKQLREVREKYENSLDSSGGGGIGIDLGGTQTGVLIALAAVVALFVLKD